MGRLRNSILAITVAFASMSAVSANAATYAWTFTDLASQLLGSGTLTTGAATTLNIGGPQMVSPVLSATGALTGIDGFTAESVSLYGSYVAPLGYAVTPDNSQTYDNAIYGSVPYIDGNGLEFIGGLTGRLINIYNNVDTGAYTAGNYPNADVIWYAGGGSRVSGTLSITAVPEPSTWAMLFVGFAVLGGMLRTRRTLSATASAA